MPTGRTCSFCVCVAGWSKHALGVYNFLLHAMHWVHPAIPGWSKWSITMVSFRPLTRVVPLRNGHSWLINGGDPNHLQVLGWTSKYNPAYRVYNLIYNCLGPTFSLLGNLWGLPISIFHTTHRHLFLQQYVHRQSLTASLPQKCLSNIIS